MTTTLAIANQKGGVAKTTTVASVGAALAELGHQVLLVDLDPQACLTFSLGIDPEDLELSVHHVLTKGLDAGRGHPRDRGRRRPAAGDHRAGPRRGRPAHPHRSRARPRGRARRRWTRPATAYDWILLDCPPSLGVLTVAALTAADGVLIPLQCETLSHRGVGQLLDTVHDVRRFTNRDLEVWGVLPTLYDGRTNHARDGAGDDLGDLRPRRHRAADPEDHQVRRGAGRRPLDPRHQPQQQGRQGLPRGGRQPGRAGGRGADEPPSGAARATPPAPPHRHAATQPRYGRIGGRSALVRDRGLVAVLGGVGVLPSVADEAGTASPGT